MRPYKTLIILLVFLVLFFSPSLFLSGPIRIGPGIIINLPELDGLEELLHYWDEKEIVPAPLEAGETVSDSLSNRIEVDSIDTLTDISSIRIPDDYPDLARLIDSIYNGRDQIRIMYYGDSQLEGDRITDYLRKELRKISGGTGPGLLNPTTLVPYTSTSYIRTSSNWERYNYLSFKNEEISHRDLGPMMGISRFVNKDDEVNTGSAWIKINPSRYSDIRAAKYDVLRLFYGKLQDTLLIEVLAGEEKLASDTLLPVERPSEYRLNLSGAQTIQINLRGKLSPDIYGLSLESENGIVVDNIPGRGSAGLDFAMVDHDNLAEIYEMLDPDLIIMHFGLNVVLNIRDEYKYYENGIIRQINRIKSVCPDVPVLIMGLTDMARLEGKEMHSYPNIPLIRDAQNQAAINTGEMFFDSWEFMGGKDAVIRWKEEDPPLISKDYTHLTYEGGHRLAEELINALLSEREIVEEADTVSYVQNLVQEREMEKDSWAPLKIISAYNVNVPMIFTTAGFWIFLFFLLAGYSLLFRKPLFRNIYLLAFSLFFYYKSGGLFFFLLVISTLTDYLAGWLIYISKRIFLRKVFVLASLVVNIGMLAYFKYTAFITGVVNDIMGTSFPVMDWLALYSNNHLGSNFDVSMIILPVGISFFTFQTVSYTLDVYRGNTKPVKSIFDFGFYVSFFPQLVAGPIVRASEFVPQLYSSFSLNRREWGHAVFLIINGLVKKILVSDYIASNFVDHVFAAPEIFSGFENLIAVYGYGLQIYCDFSGYTDIAIGVALLLGFRLPVNFNSPYKAQNLTDFWRRWHISLSRWLKDYLYISMGGNRRGRIRTGFNLLLTMLIGGLWHGAAWKFVIWGGLHGLGLIVHKIWQKIIPGQRERNKLWKLFSIILTFNFVSFCWIFFRADGMENIRIILGQIWTSFKPANYPEILYTYSQVFIIIICAYILHFLPVKIKESYRGLFIKVGLPVKIIIVYLIALALYNSGTTEFQPFIYFRF